MDLLIDYIPFIFINNTHNELSILILTITCFHFNNSKFCNSNIVNIYNTMLPSQSQILHALPIVFLHNHDLCQ